MKGLILPYTSNSTRSQHFGRRVYKVQHEDRVYWLKLQLQDGNQDYKNGFLHELDIYQQLQSLQSSSSTILADFTIFDPNQHFKIEEDILERALWIEDIPMLFASNPNDLDLVEIYSCLNLSLEVLQNLHDLNYIHGDLKIEHFRKNGAQANLIDFEQSYHCEVLNQIANTATPRYMAPELFHGQAKSFQSDIYALGIIWLQWLMQEKLTAKSYQDWAILHCQQLNVILVDRFKTLEVVLSQMLMKNKAQRCTNIYQIKQVLSQIA